MLSLVQEILYDNQHYLVLLLHKPRIPTFRGMDKNTLLEKQKELVAITTSSF